MFLGNEVQLPLDFETARVRLAAMTRDGLVWAASADAYSEGITGLMRVGTAGLSRIVRVQLSALAERPNVAGFAVRWEVTGPGAVLFPVLDADLEVVGAGPQATWLTFAGSYRPPAGPLGEALDRVILHRVATATVRNFVARIAAEMTAGSAGPAGGPGERAHVT